MEMTIEEAIKRFQNNAEYERTHGNLQGCLEFRQLAKWLGQLQNIQEIIDSYRYFLDPFDTSRLCLNKIREVLENGNVD